MARSVTRRKWLRIIRNASVVAGLLLPVVELIGDVVSLVKPMFP